MPTPPLEPDPRLYMAAERTFLAWLRTGIALMGFGFVVARFGLFLRELAAASPMPATHALGFSMPVGVALIVIGVLVNLVAGYRQARYIRALDEGNFRAIFGSRFAYLIGGLLAVIGVVMAIYLARL